MQFAGNLAFVSIGGQYRTGKSFILNQVLNLNNGFKVDPMI